MQLGRQLQMKPLQLTGVPASAAVNKALKQLHQIYLQLLTVAEVSFKTFCRMSSPWFMKQHASIIKGCAVCGMQARYVPACKLMTHYVPKPGCSAISSSESVANRPFYILPFMHSSPAQGGPQLDQLQSMP